MNCSLLKDKESGKRAEIACGGGNSNQRARWEMGHLAVGHDGPNLKVPRYCHYAHVDGSLKSANLIHAVGKMKSS
jgi:hypothetical protein